MSPDRGFILSLHPLFEPCELSVLFPAQQEAVTPELPFIPLSTTSSQTLLSFVRSWLFGTELCSLSLLILKSLVPRSGWLRSHIGGYYYHYYY